MASIFEKSVARILVFLVPMQTACVSHDHKPELAALTQSSNCEVVNGSYLLESEEDSRVLAESLFGDSDVLGALEIEKSATEVAFRASDITGQALPVVSLPRYSCTDSVLRVILNSEGSGNGLFMETTDNVLDLYSTDESTLELRFINTRMALMFLIPYYKSEDELVTLKRTTPPTRTSVSTIE